jgi:hypothetical protein
MFHWWFWSKLNNFLANILVIALCFVLWARRGWELDDCNLLFVEIRQLSLPAVRHERAPPGECWTHIFLTLVALLLMASRISDPCITCPQPCSAKRGLLPENLVDN